MKTDSKLQHDVMAELEWEPSVDHADIGVAVIDGVVTLSGFVKSYAEKVAAEAAMRRVAGVKAFAEDIKVRYPTQAKTADPEIARRILDIFAWDSMVPRDKVTAKVEHGVVTLTGTVDWYYQREAARKAASAIGGVTAVINMIEVRKQPVAADVRDRIIAAFKRQANLDANAVTVVTDGSKVILGGKVSAWHERAVAERAAWAAPGVTRVVDEIVIG